MDTKEFDRPNPFFDQAVSEGGEPSESLSSENFITESENEESETENKNKMKLAKDLADLEHSLHHMPLNYETLSNPPECTAKGDQFVAVPDRSLKNHQLRDKLELQSDIAGFKLKSS